MVERNYLVKRKGTILSREYTMQRARTTMNNLKKAGVSGMTISKRKFRATIDKRSGKYRLQWLVDGVFDGKRNFNLKKDAEDFKRKLRSRYS